MKLKNIKKIGRKFHLQVAFRCPLTLGLCLPSASRTPAKSCLRHSSTLSAVFPTRNHSPSTTSKIRLPPVKKKKYFYNKTKLLQPKNFSPAYAFRYRFYHGYRLLEFTMKQFPLQKDLSLSESFQRLYQVL